MSNLFYHKACIAIAFAILFYAHNVHEIRTLVGKSYKRQEVNVKKDIFIKKINGYDIEYDLYYPFEDPQHGVDSIILYTKKGKSRTRLLSKELGENNLQEVSIKYFLNHPFVYINADDGHGDVYGELYSLSFSPIGLKHVSELPLKSPAKVPKGYSLNKNYGIRIEDNARIFDGRIYSNATTGDLGYTIDIEYKMVRAGNSYKLKTVKQTVANYK
jgi:hypothetical protein